MAKCLVADCPNEGTDHMEITSLGGHNEGWFCPEHVGQFSRTWTRMCLRCGTAQERSTSSTGVITWRCTNCGGAARPMSLF